MIGMGRPGSCSGPFLELTGRPVSMTSGASDGSTRGDNLYPAPTLRVDPGEKLIVHYDNDLQGLTIKDFYDPAMTPKGGEVPIYPPALAEAPLNLHTHGLHVSPSGNANARS